MKKILIALFAFAGFTFPTWASGRQETGEVNYRDPASLEKLIETKSVPYVLVDVRTLEEYDAGHIPTAVNLPYDRISEKNLPTQDRGALVIVYCRSGARSSVAEASLKKLGFTNVTDFGGISRWKGRVE